VFREVREGLFLQPSLLYQTQSVVLSDTRSVTVIDPGYFPGEIALARALTDELWSVRGGEHLLALTHSDFDHIVGVPCFEDFRCATSARWDAANERRARLALRRFDGEHYIERRFPLERPVRRDLLIAADGERLGASLCFLVSGHTRDGLALFHAPSRALVVGDYLSDCEFPFIAAGADAYRASLDRLARLVSELRPELLVSQHGRPALGGRAMAERFGEATRYLDRLQEAAAGGGGVQRVAHVTRDAWRGAIPPYLWRQHCENARQALRGALQNTSTTLP